MLVNELATAAPGNVFVVGNYIDAFSFRKGLLYPSLLALLVTGSVSEFGKMNHS